MALHDSLRELVAARGAAVVDDAAELRGALDDFLGEDEATTGELNLLVDAVRLGGLSRMLTMLDHGAEPAAAVAEAGAALARDRGSDDTRRAGWAVAALGYALGRVDAPLVERSLPTSAPVDPKPATPPPPPPPPPTPQPAPDPGPGLGTVGSPEAVPTALEAQVGSVQVASVPRPAPRRKRRSVVLLAVSFAVVLGLVGGIGFALWMERDTTTNANDPEDTPTVSEPTDDSTDQPKEKGALPTSYIVVPYEDEAGSSRLWAVDTRSGTWTQLTSGTDDVLPSISPDRGQLAYLELEAPGISVLKVLDLRDLDPPILDEPASPDDAEPFFSPSGDCAHARRPGWSPDGKRLAVVCTGQTGDESVGLYTAEEKAANTDEVLTGNTFDGSPTWIDDQAFVYSIEDDADHPVAFGRYDIVAGDQGEIAIEGVTGTVSHQDWSEEAGKMLFLVHDSPADEYGELWVADADLRNAERLGDQGEVAHPVWSPDGTAIAFTVQDGDGDRFAVARVEGDGLSEYEFFEEGMPTGTVGIPVWDSR